MVATRSRADFSSAHTEMPQRLILNATVVVDAARRKRTSSLEVLRRRTRWFTVTLKMYKPQQALIGFRAESTSLLSILDVTDAPSSARDPRDSGSTGAASQAWCKAREMDPT